MGVPFLVLPFLCLIFAAPFVRARVCTHTNEIIDNYLLYYYIYKKQRTTI